MMPLPRSIQGRMLALSTVATVLALALAGLLLAGVLARFVSQGIDRRLDAELALVATSIRNDGTIDRVRLTRLQGALDAGPEWRWRIETPAERLGSGDFELEDAPPPIHPPAPPRGPERDSLRARVMEGHDARGTPVHARQLQIQTDAGLVLLTAAAPRDVIERPVRDALVPLLAMLALLGALLGVAALVQIRWGLRPVRRLRDAVAAVRAGSDRGIDEDQPVELQPLAGELNALMRDNDMALAAARASAANLAHALKTPIATLALELRGDPRGQQVDRIDATIRHHLARARNAAASRRVATELGGAVDGLVQAITRLNAERNVAIDASLIPPLTVAVDPADLDEMLGNLLDNAVRHARTRVRIEVRVEGPVVRVSVIDDGPGITASDRQRATEPGVRLDERGNGHGFGLSIVRELATLYNGSLTLDQAPGGGLSACVTLPIRPGGG